LSRMLSAFSSATQPLEYIHYNPVKAGGCNYPEDYHLSSAMF